MKNINVNPVFADILSNQEDQSISLLNIGKSFRCIVEDKVRRIPLISMAVVIAATQSKERDIIEAIDPDRVFSFNETYELKIRLTETISGSFKDLGEFEIEASKGDVSEGICRHTFNYTHLGLYQDISLPEEKEKEKFVIKILIRRKSAQGDTHGWVVQTVVPVCFEC